MGKHTILPFKPIIIIGAARSGTNALRDALVKLPDFETWPCDEINPIWKHGNTFWPNDELVSTHANPKIKNFIRKEFVKIWENTGRPSHIVEKTCANSLRVPFVNAVLPEATFIQIIRNGEDVVASARKRWKGEFELPTLPYFLAKTKFVPISDIPFYGASFLKKRLRLLFQKEKGLGMWGPNFAELAELKMQSLETICAWQWSKSVELSNVALNDISQERVMNLKYESFVREPFEEMSKIMNHLGFEFSDEAIRFSISSINAGSIGKSGKDQEVITDDVIKILEPQMLSNGYWDRSSST